MLFIEPRYFLFFAIVFSIYWTLRSNRARKCVLLVASYVFYGAWDPRFLLLLAFSTLFDFVTGLKVEQSQSETARRWLITFCVSVNLGLLFVFKYFNFFADSFVSLLHLSGIPANPVTIRVILPVGISFYTFQSLSYTLDIYRRHLRARTSLLDYATFVGFFPQLVAGPIVRAYDFLPQLDRPRIFADVPFRQALILFGFGFIKKACVSDTVAPYVDAVFADPSQYAGTSVVLAVVLYAIQIYCDFSGYTDMAIASAGLLGYRLTINFAHPYFASGVTEFWRRWHISLSTWLRDYLYISLGGNRGGKLLTYRNLMLTMVLGGLWHGASWNFVIWGTLHGLALVVEREFSAWRQRLGLTGEFRPLTVALTFWWVCFAWIFFRASSLASAATITHAFALPMGGGNLQLGFGLVLAVAALALVHWLESRRIISEALMALPRPAFYAAAGACAGLIPAFVPLVYRPFIYFQF
jgi:alginate O-acetyltransferase complex protein AlgI